MILIRSFHPIGKKLTRTRSKSIERGRNRSTLIVIDRISHPTALGCLRFRLALNALETTAEPLVEVKQAAPIACSVYDLEMCLFQGLPSFLRADKPAAAILLSNCASGLLRRYFTVGLFLSIGWASFRDATLTVHLNHKNK